MTILWISAKAKRFSLGSGPKAVLIIEMDDVGNWHLGTAGWQLPMEMRNSAELSSQLEHYAARFNAVEINTTFYRPHLAKTFERWVSTVPYDFRFSVKMHRGITHEHRLEDVVAAQRFLGMVSNLGVKLGPVLIQLPPSLNWSEKTHDFLIAIREAYDGPMVLEARHSSWSMDSATKAMTSERISGVAADPPLITDELLPTGATKLIYFRLHGSPRIYWSRYTDTSLHNVALQVSKFLKEGHCVWTIFDNTAGGAAAPDALRLKSMVKRMMGANTNG